MSSYTTVKFPYNFSLIFNNKTWLVFAEFPNIIIYKSAKHTGYNLMEKRSSSPIHHLLGLSAVGFITILAFILSPYVAIGLPMLSLLVGMAFSTLYFKQEHRLQKGVKFSQTKGLETAIVLLGFSISLTNYSGYKELYTAIPFIVLLGLVFTYNIGKRFGLSKNESMLMAFGNSICGSAAIAASAKIIKADSKEIASTLPVINLLGLILLFLLPVSFSLIPQLPPSSLAYISGATLQSVGHVGALGGTFSSDMAITALSFKMWRVFLLFPACIFLAKKVAKKDPNLTSRPPIYIWGFLATIVLSNYIHLEIFNQFAEFGKYILCFAMSAIGLTISFKSVFKNSPKLMLVGAVSILFILILNAITALILL
jgi:uncharacterized integral membrane protein (TIGR00698 family)